MIVLKAMRNAHRVRFLVAPIIAYTQYYNHPSEKKICSSVMNRYHGRYTSAFPCHVSIISFVWNSAISFLTVVPYQKVS